MRITDKIQSNPGHPLFICDFSPPRGAGTEQLEPAGFLDVDWISVAYNPGKSTRVNSAMAAYWIKANLGKDVVFTLATRDMNKVATQSLFLGAELLGLENLIVVGGDRFTERELAITRAVDDYTPTQLIRSTASMNEGIDFKGLKLREPTNLCIGSAIDMGRDTEQEVRLTGRKVEAGTGFFISQPTFSVEIPNDFLDRYQSAQGSSLDVPLFLGVQVMSPESIVFGDIPEWVTNDMENGRTGVDIALQVLNEFTEAGFDTFYLVPPILRGGRRDYEAAQATLEAFRR